MRLRIGNVFRYTVVHRIIIADGCVSVHNCADLLFIFLQRADLLFSLETFCAHSRVGRLSFDITNSPYTLAHKFGTVLPNCHRTVR